MNTNDEINFAYKVRHALNENLEHMPKAKTDRLAAARMAALARKKSDAPIRVQAQEAAFAGGARAFGEHISWLRRMGLALPLLALVIGLVGIYQFEEQQRISEIADIDAAVLSDELPLSAYMDHGFNAFLAKRGE